MRKPPFSEDLEVSILQSLPEIQRVQEMAEHYVFDGEILWSKAGKYAVKKEGNRLIVYALKGSKVPLEFFYWIQLLRKGMTFIHASGVVWNEEAFIFPAWPEAGKTSLVVTLLKKNKDLKFIGDDMVIISSNGEVYPYLRPFAVYLTHRNLFSDYFKKHPFSLFRLRIGHALVKLGIYSRFMRKFKIMEPLWIPYNEIFPGRPPAEKGKLSAVYLLKKSNKFALVPITVEEAVRSIYLQLIYDLVAPTLQDAIVLTYFGFLDLFGAIEEYYKILHSALERSESIICCNIRNNYDIYTLANIIVNDLRNKLLT